MLAVVANQKNAGHVEDCCLQDNNVHLSLHEVTGKFGSHKPWVPERTEFTSVKTRHSGSFVSRERLFFAV